MTTVQYDSPSIKILKALLRCKGQKIKVSDVKLLFTDRELIVDRLNDLVLNGHIKKQDHHYIITSRGKLIVTIFRWYRNLLGRGLGG